MSAFGKIPGLGQMLRPRASMKADPVAPPATASSASQPSKPQPSERATSVPPMVTPRQVSPVRKDEESPKPVRSVLDLTAPTEFMPTMHTESPSFMLPEDQVSVELIRRPLDNDIKEYVYKPTPLYVATSHDVYSKNYCTINIGKSLPPSIALVRYGSEADPSVGIADVKGAPSDTAEPPSLQLQFSGLSDCIPEQSVTVQDRNVMQAYCPSLTNWYSTFRAVPEDTAHLLSGKIGTDSNFLLKLLKLQMRQKAFEPLFGNATLYSIIDDEIYRVSESFHFDAAQESIRRQYGTCYVDNEGIDIHPTSTQALDFSGNCINVADASGDKKHLHMCQVTVPEELRYRDLFLVIQLSKIMSCDAEKATAPYYVRGLAPEVPKNKEACDRLCRYRQPVGVGILRLCDESGKLAGGASSGELLAQIYCQKVCLSDQQIQLAIRELYPADGSAPYVRSMDLLDMEMRVCVQDLGKDDQVVESLLAHEGGYAKLIEAAGNDHHAAKRYAPIIMPAQIQSESAQLVYSNYKSSLQRYSKPHAALSLRQMLPLLPTVSAKGTVDFTQITRQAKCGVDNTLFVYPTMLDRFKNRNLSVKVQLVEFKQEIALSQLFSCPYEVLNCVYNTTYITGPLFMPEAYSRVSYHTKNPAVNDEFKLRLPDVLSAQHWLKFTVMHLHVKPTAQRASILGKMMSSSVEVLDKTSTEVGVGFLQLMPNGDAVLDDKEHSVRVYGFEEAAPGAGTLSEKPSMHNMSNTSSMSEGLIKVRTRAVVSLTSSDKRVQAVLKSQPAPLGVFPSSIMPADVAAKVQYAAQMVPADETKMLQATRDLVYANPVALSRHFPVVFTQLLREMLAGTGNVTELYSNPFKHDPLRCQAFLTLLNVLGKVASETPSQSGPVSAEKQFLYAYVDYILDEEVPLELEDLVRAGVMTEIESEEIAAKLIEATSAAAVNAAAVAVTSTTPMKVSSQRPASTVAASAAAAAAAASAEFAAAGDATSTTPGSDSKARAESARERVKNIGVEVMFNTPLGQVAGSVTPQPGSQQSGSEDANRDPNLNIENIDLILDLTMRNTEDEVPGMSPEDFYMSDTDNGSSTARGRLSSSGFGDEVGSLQQQVSSEALRELKSFQSEDAPGLSAEDFEGGNASDAGSACSSDSDEEVVRSRGITLAGAPSGTVSPAPPKPYSASTKNGAEANSEPRSLDGSPLTPGDCAPQKLSSVRVSCGDGVAGGEDEDDEVAPRVTGSIFDMAEDAAALRSALSEGNGQGPVYMATEDAGASGKQDNCAADLYLSVRTSSPQMSPPPSTTQATVGSHSQFGLSDKDDLRIAQHFSSDRKSWGRFITDSMWTSAKLDAVGIAGLDANSSSELRASISSKYLDDIAAHVALQAEKLVLEEMLGLAVQVITLEVPYGDSGSGRPQSQSRKQAEALARGMPTEDQILAGKRFRLSKRISTRTPFQEDRTWFAAVDVGKLIDDSDVSIRNRSNTEASLATTALNRHKQQESVLERDICIEPVLPVFDPIEGYKARSKKLRGTDLTEMTARYQHWWPWLYEVLVFQWGAIMTISLSTLKLISGNNTQSMVGAYPNEAEIKEQSTRGPLKADSVRSLLAEHCPMLLRMVYKSLALRISREGLRAPVVLDVQFMGAIENLVMLLAVEAASYSSGLWRSRKLVSSLAAFLRSLFALVSPNQVIRLIRSYFRASRRNSRVEEAELRLQMVEELGWFDHFVAVNFPYTIDAPLQSFAFECVVPPNHAAFCTYSTSAYTAVGIRGITNPTPYSFVHIFVAEIVMSYRQEERKIKDAALEVLRDLLVRHAYDARYQSKMDQQRVACMYLPLLTELLKQHQRIAGQKHDSTERKDVLAIFLYLFQGMPDRVLRHFIRTLCVEAEDPEVATTGSEGPGTLHRVLSLKSDRSRSTPVTKAFIPPRMHKDLQVFHLLLMLHCTLDTFECPKIPADKPLAAASAVFSGAATAAQVTTSAYSQVLAPGVVLEGASDTTAGAPVRRATTEGSTPQVTAGKNVGGAASMKKSLDQRLQSKKTTVIAARRGSAGKGEERQWVEHARKMADTGDVRSDRVVLKMPITKQSQSEAAQEVCELASRTVVSVLLVLFEVCPPELATNVSADSGGVAQEYAFILRDSNIDEALLVGISNLRVVYFMREALSVILHGLYCNQTDELLCLLFSAASTAIRNFGAKVFLVAVEDSLQDWMRAALFHCASPTESLSHTASNFILYLLRACFHYLGTATLVSNTILAVINDVVETILDNYQHQIKTYSDEDAVLRDLDSAIAKMKSVAQNSITTVGSGSGGWSQPNLGVSNTAAFCKSVVNLMENLEIILLANADLRRHVSHPVGYDFYGSNMLDGPWNERNSALMSTIRNKRRNVLPDPVAGKQTPVSGFQLEEVMMHLAGAAEVYDPFKLPRLRMYWLENLAMLHKRNVNRAEGAEIRWRIFKLCELVEDTWRQQWVPRPPLPWSRRGCSIRSADSQSPLLQITVPGNVSSVANAKTAHLSIGRQGETTAPPTPDADATERDRNFYAVLKAALDAKANRAWQDSEQYLSHMQVSLDEATKGYNGVNLIHLAERTSFRLVHLYRLLKKPERMLAEYTKMADAVKTIADKGVTTSMAIGTFYRVFYDGQGVPEHLRNKEFIFRNGNHMHVKEFQDQVVGHLKSIVDEGVSVLIVQNIGADHALNDPKLAFIIMNSVKVMKNAATELSIRTLDNPNACNKRPSSFQHSADKSNIEAANQVRIFHYSVPFTLTGRSHAKSIDEQWMRSTILTVKEPFPYIMTRQLVQSREIRTYSPIEVAIYDIEERIEAMESELEKVVRNLSDCNNLMRIVQGTVMPQVNAGVGEVAKVFLNQRSGGSSSSSAAGSAKDATLAHISASSVATSNTASTATSAIPSAPTSGVSSAAVSGKPTASDSLALSASLPTSSRTGGSMEDPGNSTAATCASPVPQDDASTPGSTVSPDAEKYERRQEELVLKLKVTLIDFLSCSKLLLLKARGALIDGQRSSSSDSSLPSPIMNPSISSGSLTQTAANRASSGGGPANIPATTTRASLGASTAAAVMGTSAAATAAAESAEREREQFHNWQKEMEHAFKNLLRSIKPYFSDWHDSDVLATLQKDLNESI